MKGVEAHDRPREKLSQLGPAALGDNELLAAVIGCGVRSMNALAVANQVLEEAGGLHALSRSSYQQLRRIRGLGPARAAQVVAALELGRRSLLQPQLERLQVKSPRDVAMYLLPAYGNRSTEQFGVLMLDTKHRVLRASIISAGTLDGTVVQPRDVFREAATAGAAAVILFHNHPSGDPSPSPEDVALTFRLIEAGQLLGITVVDHVVLGDGQFCSLRESGRIR